MKHFLLPNFNFHFERWKWNNEYRVYVSTLGHFKNEYKNPIPIKIAPAGYILIKTCCGYKFAHRLVMMTWNPTNGMENLTVDHLNHNKRDNSLKNLEWVSQEENCLRAEKDYCISSLNESIICCNRNIHFRTSQEAAEWVKSTKSCINDPNITINSIFKKIDKIPSNFNNTANKKYYNAYGYVWCKG